MWSSLLAAATVCLHVALASAQTPPPAPRDTAFGAGAARRAAETAGAVNTAPYTSAKLSARDAWARPAQKGATGAAYITFENAGALPIRIVGISSPVARVVEAHETMHHGGMARMRPVPALQVPARGRLELKPGGLHLMLVDLARPLVAGETVPLTFRTSDGATFMVTARVRAP